MMNEAAGTTGTETAAATVVALGFETRVCSRCAGSGTYSRCQMWGTTCFKCGGTPHVPGKGYTLTKRGEAARLYFRSLLPTKRVGDLVVGDVFNERGRRTVTELGDVREYTYAVNGVAKTVLVRDVVTKNVTFAQMNVDDLVKLLPTVEQRDALLAQAIAYQATLTATGTVRKRAAKVAA